MSCGKYLTIDINRNIGCKNAHNDIDKCNVISLTNKELNKYHHMNDSSHFTMFKRNQTILQTSEDTVPKKQRNGVVAGRSKHGSYQRYLASKTAKAGYCKPSEAIQTEYKNKTIYVSNIDKAVFKNKVTPEDNLEVRAKIISFKRGIAKCEAETFFKSKLASKAQINIIIPDLLKQFTK